MNHRLLGPSIGEIILHDATDDRTVHLLSCEDVLFAARVSRFLATIDAAAILLTLEKNMRSSGISRIVHYF